MKGGGEGAPSSGVSALPLIPVNDQFTLNKDEAWYTLSIETQVNKTMYMCTLYSIYQLVCVYVLFYDYNFYHHSMYTDLCFAYYFLIMIFMIAMILFIIMQLHVD